MLSELILRWAQCPSPMVFRLHSALLPRASLTGPTSPTSAQAPKEPTGHKSEEFPLVSLIGKLACKSQDWEGMGVNVPPILLWSRRLFLDIFSISMYAPGKGRMKLPDFLPLL